MIISFNCNAFKIVVLRDVYHWDQPVFGCLGWFGFPVFYWEKLFFVVWLISFFNQLWTCLKWLKPKTVRKVQRSVLLWHLNQISQTWFRLKRFAPIEHALKSIWQDLEASFHKWSPATAAIESLQQWYENLAIQSLHSLRGFAALGLFTWLLPITELSFSVMKKLLTIIGNNIQTTQQYLRVFSDHVPQCDRANPCYEANKCENRVPGYQCAACPDGYRGNAPSGVGLEDAQNSKQVCQEIDECKEGISTCDPNAQCINTNVSFVLFCRYEQSSRIILISVIFQWCLKLLHLVFALWSCGWWA